MEVNKYNCPIIPGKRRCKVLIEHEDPLNLKWEEYFDNIEIHPDNSFMIIKNNDCYIMVLSTGWIDILQADNDKIIDKYTDIIKKVVENGVSY